MFCDFCRMGSAQAAFGDQVLRDGQNQFRIIQNQTVFGWGEPSASKRPMELQSSRAAEPCLIVASELRCADMYLLQHCHTSPS